MLQESLESPHSRFWQSRAGRRGAFIPSRKAIAPLEIRQDSSRHDFARCSQIALHLCKAVQAMVT